ncbi:unnamed protein product [Rhizophagus irregularis]|nr:unnamed protein product [Rhizophagus irregularis]
MKAVFNKKFTSDSYEELQKCLEEEFSILPKVFVNFVNLPNIHVNMHLLMHAKTFGTLINTQVDLDLLKRYNTLFAIRHLADGGIDPRFNRSCTGFTNSNFGQLFLNWYVTEDKYSTEATEQVQDDDDDTKIISPLVQIASYMIEEENGILSKVHLHLDDFITIYEEDHEESYAIIKGIFQHKGNNNKYYAFIVVDWFEDIMVEHSVLKCPLYRLQATGDKWRRIFQLL